MKKFLKVITIIAAAIVIFRAVQIIADYIYETYVKKYIATEISDLND